MGKVKKEPREERWQTHVYLSPDDFVRLKLIADTESRSMTGQIEYFLKRAISSYHEPSDKAKSVIR